MLYHRVGWTTTRRALFQPPSHIAAMSTPPAQPDGDGGADNPDEPSRSPAVARTAPSPSSSMKTPCAFFARGRCVSGDACAYSHVIDTRFGRSRATHASNCGCRACVPRASGDDGDENGGESSSSESEEGAVPRDVAAREALDRARARDAILADAHTITQPSRVMFWRTFLSAIGNGRGNKLAPYWLATTPRTTKRRRVDARVDGVGALVSVLAKQNAKEDACRARGGADARTGGLEEETSTP
jgi:hypothetical protein